MFVLFITVLTVLIIFNLFIWIYESNKLNTSIEKSKRILRVGLIVTILNYLITAIWVWLFMRK